MTTQKLEDTTETSGKLHEVSAASAVCWHSRIQQSQRQVKPFSHGQWDSTVPLQHSQVSASWGPKQG